MLANASVSTAPVAKPPGHGYIVRALSTQRGKTVELLCLDLEGVLIPEIWINFAEKTGIDELRATTRDIPDYDELMRMRLRILDEHGSVLRHLNLFAGEQTRVCSLFAVSLSPSRPSLAST